ncbi:unnamed protein product [Amaranthus hypochondriacus]
MVDDDNDGASCFPKFFKLILASPRPDLHKLEIPREFMKNHGNEVLDEVYLNVPNGEQYKVKLKRENGKVWLKNGWMEFVASYSISHGHFLMFIFKGSSHFDVHIFDMTTSEIDYTLFHPKKYYNSLPKPTMFNTNIKHKNGEKGKPLFMGRLSRRFYSKSHFSYEEIQKVNACPCEYPSFAIKLQRSYLKFKFHANVALPFAKKYFTNKDNDVVFKNVGGETWQVKIGGSDSNGMKMSRGWPKFAKDNKLQVGDICVLELMKSCTLLFKVHIIRVRGDAETDAQGVQNMAQAQVKAKAKAQD